METNLRPFLSAFTRQTCEASLRASLSTNNWQASAEAHSKTDIHGRIRKLLQYVHGKSGYPGALILLERELDYPLVDAENPDAFKFVIEDAIRQAYLEHQASAYYRLMTRGLDRLATQESDLAAELQKSDLSEAQSVLRALRNSEDAFGKEPPDYNGCLSNARVALQTLATAIARVRLKKHTGSFDEGKWGQVLAYLRTSGLITSPEEEGIAGVYGFVSPGAHSSIMPSESHQEMARLGKRFIDGMCYFLVKRYNGTI